MFKKPNAKYSIDNLKIKVLITQDLPLRLQNQLIILKILISKNRNLKVVLNKIDEGESENHSTQNSRPTHQTQESISKLNIIISYHRIVQVVFRKIDEGESENHGSENSNLVIRFHNTLISLIIKYHKIGMLKKPYAKYSIDNIKIKVFITQDLPLDSRIHL